MRSSALDLACGALGAVVLLVMVIAGNRHLPPPVERPGPSVNRPGWVLLRVTEKGTGRPIVLAGVTVDPVARGGKAHFQTNRDGTAWIGPIRPGPVSILLDHGHYVSTHVFRFADAVPVGRGHPEISAEMARASDVDDPPAEKLLYVPSAKKPVRGEMRILCFAPDGTPVRSLFVEVRGTTYHFPCPDRPVYIVETDRPVGEISFADGVTAVEILEPGDPVWIRVSDAQAEDGTPLGGVIEGPIAIRPGDLKITLPPERHIRGRVVDEAGEAVPDAWVRLFPDHRSFKRRHGSGPVSMQVDENGCFEFGGLGEFCYLVFANAGAWYLDTGHGRIVPPAEDLEFVLRAGVQPEIRVLDYRGRTVDGAEVWINPPDYSPLIPSGVADTNGIARPGTFDPDERYDFWVRDTRSDHRLAIYCEPDWRPEDRTVTLERTASIRGYVLDELGEPFRGCSVWWTEKPGVRRREHCSAAGWFELRVPVGTSHALRAVPWNLDPDDYDSAEVVAAAGVEGVVLRAYRGGELKVEVTNWPAGAGGQAVLETDDGVLVGLHSYSRRDGTFRFEGLSRGTDYRLKISPNRGSMALTRSGVRTGAGKLRVELEPGLVIEGRVALPAGAKPYSVVAVQGEMYRSGTVTRDGEFRIEGLCEGTWTVIAVAVDSLGNLEGRTEIPAGGTGRVTLERR